MDGSILIVKPLTTDNLAETAEVYLNCRHFLVDLSGEDPGSLGLELVKREADDAQAHCAVFAGIRLTENRQMVGVVTYQPGGYRDQRSQAWIALLMIAEKFQSLGYGAEAYRLVEETIFARPEIISINLGVLTNNAKALRFWQKMGYRDTGIRKQDDTGHEIIVMEKLKTASGG